VSIELSAVAAGLPMAASFAMAGGFIALREGRRRTSLNAAMHELRRPLQALCLSLPPTPDAGQPLSSSLELAVAAVEQLDREINGRPVEAEMTPVCFRSIVEAAVKRWRPAADSLDRSLDLRWSGDDAVLQADRIVLVQAVDNLISNALRHGSGPVTVTVRADVRVLRITVGDRGRPVASSPRRPWKRPGGRSRHGHGLGIVRRAAARHGGSFRLRVAQTGTEARLVLPLREGRG
jgi:signal transduction histidine kinase